MSFGEQLRRRREELHISREELAGKLGVSRSAIGNYETGVSFPKEEVLLALFDAIVGIGQCRLFPVSNLRKGGGLAVKSKSEKERSKSEKGKVKTRTLAHSGFWWGMVDSNHRRRCQQIYSLSPLATREIPHMNM